MYRAVYLTLRRETPCNTAAGLELQGRLLHTGREVPYKYKGGAVSALQGCSP